MGHFKKKLGWRRVVDMHDKEAFCMVGWEGLIFGVCMWCGLVCGKGKGEV